MNQIAKVEVNIKERAKTSVIWMRKETMRNMMMESNMMKGEDITNEGSIGMRETMMMIKGILVITKTGGEGTMMGEGEDIIGKTLMMKGRIITIREESSIGMMTEIIRREDKGIMMTKKTLSRKRKNRRIRG